MAEESTENSTSSEQQQSNENITIPPISKPAAGAKAVNRAVRAVHDRRNRVTVARPKSVAHRRERQREVVRNRPHVLDVPRKSGARKLNAALIFVLSPGEICLCSRCGRRRK